MRDEEWQCRRSVRVNERERERKWESESKRARERKEKETKREGERERVSEKRDKVMRRAMYAWESTFWERVHKTVNILMKKKKWDVILPNFSLSQKRKKKKFSLTYYNRIPKLTTILIYVLPRVNPLIINLHAICINYLVLKRASSPKLGRGEVEKKLRAISSVWGLTAGRIDLLKKIDGNFSLRK